MCRIRTCVPHKGLHHRIYVSRAQHTHKTRSSTPFVRACWRAFPRRAHELSFFNLPTFIERVVATLRGVWRMRTRLDKFTLFWEFHALNQPFTQCGPHNKTPSQQQKERVNRHKLAFGWVSASLSYVCCSYVACAARASAMRESLNGLRARTVNVLLSMLPTVSERVCLCVCVDASTYYLLVSMRSLCVECVYALRRMNGVYVCTTTTVQARTNTHAHGTVGR